MMEAGKKMGVSGQTSRQGDYIMLRKTNKGREGQQDLLWE